MEVQCRVQRIYMRKTSLADLERLFKREGFVVIVLPQDEDMGMSQ